MNIEILVKCLSESEKRKLLDILILELPYKSPTGHLTPIREWLAIHEGNLGVALTTILLYGSRGDPPFEFVEQINRAEFYKCRGAGKKSWNKFEKLRGY